MLGKYRETGRGFGLVEFSDVYGCKCSLQQSSAIDHDEHSLYKPGSSFVWLGVNDPDPKVLKSQAETLGLTLPPGEVSGWMPYPIPKEVFISTRMHLNREQVKGLVERLQQWLATGTLAT